MIPLTENSRNAIQEEVLKALGEHLKSDTSALAFFFISASEDSTSFSHGVQGTISGDKVMAAFTVSLFELGVGMGVSPEDVAKAICSSVQALAARKEDNIQRNMELLQ